MGIFYLSPYNSLLQRKPLSKIAVKGIAFLLVAAFTVQEVSFAGVDVSSALMPLPAFAVKFPGSLASVEESYRAPGGEKTVVLIQDAHTNESAQRNIARTIEIILENGLTRHVFLEAGTGDLSLSYLRRAPRPLRERVARSFLSKGYIQGPDFLDLTSDKPFKLWGIEDQKLYFRGIELYRSLCEMRLFLHAHLDKIDRAVRTLKPKVYNPELRNFDEVRVSFLANERPLTEYFEALFQRAERLNIRLDAFPHLSGLKRLKRLEASIDFVKAGQEQIRLVASLGADEQRVLLELSSEQGPMRLEAEESGPQRAFYAMLEEKVRKRSDYPNLMRYLHYLKGAHRLSSRQIVSEKEALESAVFAVLAAAPDEQRLLAIARAQEVLRKLLDLTLTTDEFDEMKRDRASYDATAAAGFLNRKIMDLGSHYEDALFLETRYDGALSQAVEFYELTLARDEAFVSNLTAKMDETGESCGILVTGGFHTPHLKELLRERRISYLVVTPQVLKETNLKKYENILLRQVAALPRAASATLPAAPAARWGIVPAKQLTLLDESTGKPFRVSELLENELGQAQPTVTDGSSRVLLDYDGAPTVSETGAVSPAAAVVRTLGTRLSAANHVGEMTSGQLVAHYAGENRNLFIVETGPGVRRNDAGQKRLGQSFINKVIPSILAVPALGIAEVYLVDALKMERISSTTPAADGSYPFEEVDAPPLSSYSPKDMTADNMPVNSLVRTEQVYGKAQFIFANAPLSHGASGRGIADVMSAAAAPGAHVFVRFHVREYMNESMKNFLGAMSKLQGRKEKVFHPLHFYTEVPGDYPPTHDTTEQGDTTVPLIVLREGPITDGELKELILSAQEALGSAKEFVPRAAAILLKFLGPEVPRVLTAQELGALEGRIDRSRGRLSEKLAATTLDAIKSAAGTRLTDGADEQKFLIPGTQGRLTARVWKEVAFEPAGINFKRFTLEISDPEKPLSTAQIVMPGDTTTASLVAKFGELQRATRFDPMKSRPEFVAAVTEDFARLTPAEELFGVATGRIETGIESVRSRLDSDDIPGAEAEMTAVNDAVSALEAIVSDPRVTDLFDAAFSELMDTVDSLSAAIDEKRAELDRPVLTRDTARGVILKALAAAGVEKPATAQVSAIERFLSEGRVTPGRTAFVEWLKKSRIVKGAPDVKARVEEAFVDQFRWPKEAEKAPVQLTRRDVINNRLNAIFKTRFPESYKNFMQTVFRTKNISLAKWCSQYMVNYFRLKKDRADFGSMSAEAIFNSDPDFDVLSDPGVVLKQLPSYQQTPAVRKMIATNLKGTKKLLLDIFRTAQTDPEFEALVAEHIGITTAGARLPSDAVIERVRNQVMQEQISLAGWKSQKLVILHEDAEFTRYLSATAPLFESASQNLEDALGTSNALFKGISVNLALESLRALSAPDGPIVQALDYLQTPDLGGNRQLSPERRASSTGAIALRRIVLLTQELEGKKEERKGTRLALPAEKIGPWKRAVLMARASLPLGPEQREGLAELTSSLGVPASDLADLSTPDAKTWALPLFSAVLERGLYERAAADPTGPARNGLVLAEVSRPAFVHDMGHVGYPLAYLKQMLLEKKTPAVEEGLDALLNESTPLSRELPVLRAAMAGFDPARSPAWSPYMVAWLESYLEDQNRINGRILETMRRIDDGSRAAIAQINGTMRFVDDGVALQSVLASRREVADAFTPAPVTAHELDSYVRRIRHRWSIDANFASAAETPPVDMSTYDFQSLTANLIGNARDAASPERPLEVTVSFQPSTDGTPRVALVVSDNGTGMEAALRDRLLARNQFTTKEKGSGLGLVAAREILDRIGGTLEIQSTPGIGSTFTAWLPAATAVSPVGTRLSERLASYFAVTRAKDITRELIGRSDRDLLEVYDDILRTDPLAGESVDEFGSHAYWVTTETSQQTKGSSWIPWAQDAYWQANRLPESKTQSRSSVVRLAPGQYVQNKGTGNDGEWPVTLYDGKLLTHIPHYSLTAFPAYKDLEAVLRLNELWRKLGRSELFPISTTVQIVEVNGLHFRGREVGVHSYLKTYAEETGAELAQELLKRLSSNFLLRGTKGSQSVVDLETAIKQFLKQYGFVQARSLIPGDVSMAAVKSAKTKKSIDSVLGALFEAYRESYAAAEWDPADGQFDREAYLARIRTVNAAASARIVQRAAQNLGSIVGLCSGVGADISESMSAKDLLVGSVPKDFDSAFVPPRNETRFVEAYAERSAYEQALLAREAVRWLAELLGQNAAAAQAELAAEALRVFAEVREKILDVPSESSLTPAYREKASAWAASGGFRVLYAALYPRVDFMSPRMAREGDSVFDFFIHFEASVVSHEMTWKDFEKAAKKATHQFLGNEGARGLHQILPKIRATLGDDMDQAVLLVESILDAASGEQPENVEAFIEGYFKNAGTRLATREEVAALAAASPNIRALSDAWAFTPDEIQRLADWYAEGVDSRGQAVSTAPLLPSDPALTRKLFYHLFAQMSDGSPMTAVTSASNVKKWTGALSERWGLRDKKFTGLLRWFVSNKIRIQNVSPETLDAFLQAYLESYRSAPALRDNYTYTVPPGISDEEKVRLAGGNIRRMMSMFSPKFVRKSSVIKAHVPGTPFFVGMQFGLAESTHGLYLAMGEDRLYEEEVDPLAGVFFRIGLDSQGDDLRIIMMQGVSGRQETINTAFPEKMGLHQFHPGIALMYVALDIAYRGHMFLDGNPSHAPPFTRLMGVNPAFIPTMKNGTPTVNLFASYNRFGLRESDDFSHWRAVSYLVDTLMRGRVAEDGAKGLAILKMQETFANLAEIPVRLASGEGPDDELPEKVHRLDRLGTRLSAVKEGEPIQARVLPSLRALVAGVTSARGKDADGRDFAVELPYIDRQTGREVEGTTIFRLAVSGHRVEARAAGVEPIVIDDNRQAETVAAPKLNMSDLRSMEDVVTKAVHEALAAVRVRAAEGPVTTKIIALDLDAIPDGSFDSKLTAFADEFAKAQQSYGSDGVLELTGDPVRIDRALKNAQVAALMSAGGLFDSRAVPSVIEAALASGSAARVRIAGVSRDSAKPVLRPDERLLPMRRLADNDVPAVRAVFEMGLALAAADLSPGSRDIADIAIAWRAMSGRDIASDVLRSIVQNAADFQTILLHALAPVAPVDIDLAVRYLQYRMNVDRSA